MCRLLMVRADKRIDPGPFLESFSELARTTPAPDGDAQADGWGIAWREGDLWRIFKSERPIWKERLVFGSVPPASAFCVHARSASFSHQKKRVDLNQPYLDGAFAYVFNGFLEGVAPPIALPGEIGAQKIWSRLKSRLAEAGEGGAEDALDELAAFLDRHTRRIRGLNIGLNDGRRLYALTRFDADEKYYRLQASRSPAVSIVCSGPLPGWDFEPLPPGRAVVL
jgi:predicted glutamine amidotransferase